MTHLYQPLPDRMRPNTLAAFFGQQHLLGTDKPLQLAITQGHLHSMILWGPPGTGKTTLAKLFAHSVDANFMSLSAVFSGVKEIREAVAQAQLNREQFPQKTILFIDEIHRFNKSQQDAFLPYVENGTFILIGATTENPSFEVNSALLSRARVYVLQRLTQDDLLAIIDHALQSPHGLAHLHIDFPVHLREQLAQLADGDARRCLMLLEILSDLCADNTDKRVVTQHHLTELMSSSTRRFDKGGDDFYDQISALHKSVRGSDPDAALYWYARMLDGGCDPLYLARRVIRMASEDIGNADPRGLALALDAAATYERLGSPEGELAIAQAIVYLASTAKSNAVYSAFKAAQADVREYGSLEVPLHLRNAPTKLMKNLRYGADYRYAHDEENAYAAGENYFPDGMPKRRYYQPVDRGLESKIKQKLEGLRELDQRMKNDKAR